MPSASRISTRTAVCRVRRGDAATGLAAVFTFPLLHDTDRLGALSLYRGTVGALDPQDVTIAKTLADVTAAYLVMAGARDAARAAAESFKQIALHDLLTGLPNRQLLEERTGTPPSPAGAGRPA